MTRLDAIQLRNLIKTDQFDYLLLSSALSAYSGVRQKIHQLLQKGVIVQVKKGLYVFGPDYFSEPICKETLANLIYGPSYISLEYALSYYGFIPERVETITSITPKRDKSFQTPFGNFTYRYLHRDKYAIGIEQIWIDERHPVLMASGEKALCDYIVLNKISHLASTDDARHFLQNDLRIERENWKRFNTSLMLEINVVYQNEAISHVIEALK